MKPRKLLATLAVLAILSSEAVVNPLFRISIDWGSFVPEWVQGALNLPERIGDGISAWRQRRCRCA